MTYTDVETLLLATGEGEGAVKISHFLTPHFEGFWGDPKSPFF